MKKVMLLAGGWSAERDVSLNKGTHVEAALKEAGYDVAVCDPSQDLAEFLQQLERIQPDVVFNNLHGRWGEDGHFQAVLNLRQIPYTHSGVLASSVAMDKRLSKRIAYSLGIDCPKWRGVHAISDVESALDDWSHICLKPACEGSSVHTYILQTGDNRLGDLAANIDFSDVPFMVEEYIAGQELTVAVLDGQAQNVTEIIAETGFFDYEAKYAAETTRYEMPANIPTQIFDMAKTWSAAFFQAVGARGLARCDYRYDAELDRLSFLEMNTQPGLTAQSIGPSQVIANGRSFSQLCAHLIETAQCD